MDAKAAPTFVEPMATQAANQGVEALKDIACGSAAGTVGKIVEYPFDTVKVRLQSQPDHLPLQYKGPLDCFRQSIARDGVRGLYRGVSAPLVGAGAETASLFFSYRIAQDILRAFVLPADIGDKLPLGALVASGAMSGGVTSVILTPIELIKCRMQVPLHSPQDLTLNPRNGLNSTALGPLAVIGNVYRRVGLIGFWRGQLGTFVREMGGSAAWFGSYETLSLLFKKRLEARGKAGDVPIHQQMTAGALAGISYNFLFYPADTIKSRIQTGDLAQVGQLKQTFWKVGKALWRTHGLNGLYRGCGITLVRSAPSSALIFTIYEAFRKAFA